MRARNRDGSVVLDKRIKTWNFFFWENGKRRSKKIGTVSQYPTKASAWRAAKALKGVAADNTYGNGEMLQWLDERGITPYIRVKEGPNSPPDLTTSKPHHQMRCCNEAI